MQHLPACTCSRGAAALQEVAKEVEAIMKDVTNLADNMLPGQGPDKGVRSVQEVDAQPLRERLLNSWNGKVAEAMRSTLCRLNA